MSAGRFESLRISGKARLIALQVSVMMMMTEFRKASWQFSVIYISFSVTLLYYLPNFPSFVFSYFVMSVRGSKYEEGISGKSSKVKGNMKRRE